MGTEEFFDLCNRSVKGGPATGGSKVMNTFGAVDGKVSVSEEGDFEDDFGDDFEEGSEDGLGNSPGKVDAGQPITNGNAFRIQSVSVATASQKVDAPFDITQEIRGFLLGHGEEKANDNVPLNSLWNHLYNDSLVSESQVIEKYLRVHYGLWFNEGQALEEAVSEGGQFLRCLKFDFRVCTLSDIRFIRQNWEKEWYDPDVVNEFAVDVNFVPQLMLLMEKGKVDTEAMMCYRDNPEALMCCIRLLCAEKFVKREFDAEFKKGTALLYTDGLLSEQGNRFGCVSGRPDFNEVKAAVLGMEKAGRVVHTDVMERFADAFYLTDILAADADGRLNEGFVRNYLMDDLGNFKFIAKLYGDGDVDVGVCPGDFMYSKVITDVTKLGLDVEPFARMKGGRGLSCLVCSRFGGVLPEVDYRKFLAVLSFVPSGHVMEQLNARERLVASYNQFWFMDLFRTLGLDCQVPADVGDNILFIKVVGDRRRKYYLQLDDYVLNRGQFLGLVDGCVMAVSLNDSEGFVLSNGKWVGKAGYSFSVDSSMTAWAKGNVDRDAMLQFKEHNPIVHTNFLQALSNVGRRLQNMGGDDRVNTAVMEFLHMDWKQYYNYDKMFGFISRHPEFMGIFTSRNAVVLLKLFSNVCIYRSSAQIMFMFLYVVMVKFSRNNFSLMSTGFSGLDGSKSVLIVDGVKVQNPCLSFRTVSDSIDNFITLAKNSKKVVLKISERTINLQFE